MLVATPRDEAGKHTVTCTVCGYSRYTHWPVEQVHHHHHPGLGTVVQRGLKLIGITQPRYIRLKTIFGLQPQCGCEDRQQFLDKLGVRLSVQWLKVVERVQSLFNRTEKH